MFICSVLSIHSMLIFAVPGRAQYMVNTKIKTGVRDWKNPNCLLLFLCNVHLLPSVIPYLMTETGCSFDIYHYGTDEYKR